MPVVLLDRVRTRFRELFGGEPAIALCPGRVNLIGEHTDYNEGFVLPVSVDRYIVVAFASNGLSTLRAHSLDYDGRYEAALDALAPTGDARWCDYVGGVVWAMKEAGSRLYGLDLVVTGDVPIGAGLASSAALEIATARAVVEVAGEVWDPKRAARAARRAENEYVGVPCGIMDQLTVASSEQGCAMLLDCRDLSCSYLPVPEEAAVVVMDTGTRRTLAGSRYKERRVSCEKAVEALRGLDPSIRALRDVTPELLEQARDRMDEVAYRRARHVVGENRRTLEAGEALRDGDLERAGCLMDESHESLRNLYEVSSLELDLMSTLARGRPACWGARMSGAGFGGCGVALVRAEAAEAFAAEIGRDYEVQSGVVGSVYVCRPVAGAAVIGGGHSFGG